MLIEPVVVASHHNHCHQGINIILVINAVGVEVTCDRGKIFVPVNLVIRKRRGKCIGVTVSVQVRGKYGLGTIGRGGNELLSCETAPAVSGSYRRPWTQRGRPDLRLRLSPRRIATGPQYLTQSLAAVRRFPDRRGLLNHRLDSFRCNSVFYLTLGMWRNWQTR